MGAALPAAFVPLQACSALIHDLIHGFSVPPRVSFDDIDRLLVGNTVLAKYLFQICHRLSRIPQREPLAVMVPIMIKAFRHDRDGRVTLQQCPDQIEVIYAGVISNAFVQTAGIENGLPAKQEKMPQVARPLLQRRDRIEFLQRWVPARALVDRAIRKINDTSGADDIRVVPQALGDRSLVQPIVG